MSKHTEGPWAWRGKPGRSTLESAVGKVIDYAGYEGMWPGAYDDETDAANLRLIAAAPDLLAFVKDWLADFTAAGTTDSPHEAHARAAIAKAEGAAA